MSDAIDRPWSGVAVRGAGERMRACAAAYHEPRDTEWWPEELALQAAFDRARDDLRAILDYRLRVRRACAAIRAGASLSEVEP